MILRRRERREKRREERRMTKKEKEKVAKACAKVSMDIAFADPEDVKGKTLSKITAETLKGLMTDIDAEEEWDQEVAVLAAARLRKDVEKENPATKMFVEMLASILDAIAKGDEDDE